MMLAFLSFCDVCGLGPSWRDTWEERPPATGWRGCRVCESGSARRRDTEDHIRAVIRVLRRIQWCSGGEESPSAEGRSRGPRPSWLCEFSRQVRGTDMPRAFYLFAYEMVLSP